MVASQARPAYIYDTTLGDWVPMSGVVDTGQAYTFTANQTFNGLVNANNGINAATTLSLQTGGVNRLSIDSSGRVTTPNNPSFNVAKADNGGVISAGDYPFDLILSNNGNHYSTSNYRFTAPVSGDYFFTAGIQMYGIADGTGTEINFKKNGSNYISTGTAPGFRTIVNKVNTLYHNVAYISGIIPLAVNDYVTVYHSGYRGMQSHFSGFLVG
jgi:hypothetical protein